MSEDFCFLFPKAFTDDDKDFQRSIFRLNLYLGGAYNKQPPHRIDYNILLVSYHLWNGKDLDEFCRKQTLSHFLFNPEEDSIEAREAYYLEIWKFLAGN